MKGPSPKKAQFLIYVLPAVKDLIVQQAGREGMPIGDWITEKLTPHLPPIPVMPNLASMTREEKLAAFLEITSELADIHRCGPPVGVSLMPPRKKDAEEPVDDLDDDS